MPDPTREDFWEKEAFEKSLCDRQNWKGWMEKSGLG